MPRTVGKIYTPIFWFFRKRFVNIAFIELRSLLNERSDNFTFYRGNISNFKIAIVLKKKMTNQKNPLYRKFIYVIK